MEQPEITAGLKNALDRGYSLEIAIQSFINAGYNKRDVEDSAKVLGNNEGIISSLPQQVIIPKIISKEELKETEETKEKPLITRKWFIISIAVILIILFGALAFLIFTKII